jgi:GNAT superfamily N-acetyltransferase
VPAANYELRELRNSDGCSALSLGDAALTPLKTFLRKEAKKLHQENLARTFVLAEQKQARVWAYVTTLCTHIAIEQIGEPALVDNYRYKDYPAIKLARLAVDTAIQGQGVGKQLVNFIIGQFTEYVMPNTGCRFLVVDAKPNSIAFYERKGFRKIKQMGDEGHAFTTMVLDLHRLNLAV